MLLEYLLLNSWRTPLLKEKVNLAIIVCRWIGPDCVDVTQAKFSLRARNRRGFFSCRWSREDEKALMSVNWVSCHGDRWMCCGERLHARAREPTQGWNRVSEKLICTRQGWIRAIGGGCRTQWLRRCHKDPACAWITSHHGEQSAKQDAGFHTMSLIREAKVHLHTP